MSHVGYFRVSTVRQGRSGLGLEAQQEAVARHLAGLKLLASFIEIESGKRNDRPQLAAALALCRLHKAVLVIARLDRLARNVAFISALMESDIEFIACDFPQANRLTLHVLAAVAEHEARMISERTRAALTAARARGTKLGCPLNGTAALNARATVGVVAAADAFAARVMEEIRFWQARGITTPKELADILTAQRMPTRYGRERWSPIAVKNVIARALRVQPAVLAA